jgi:hypothetical protein
LAGVAALAVASVAAGAALREAYGRLPRPAGARTVSTWLGSLLSAGLAGTTAAVAAAAVVATGYPEETLLAAAGAFLAVVVATVALADRVARRHERGAVPCAGHAARVPPGDHGGTS